MLNTEALQDFIDTFENYCVVNRATEGVKLTAMSDAIPDTP
jgi:hypothetical protein